MAAPHVAGAAAILKEINNQLTPDQIEFILKHSGKPVYDDDTGLTFPRIDVGAAVHYLLNCTTPASGDWTVENTTYCFHETLDAAEGTDLKIQTGKTLYMENVSLELDAPDGGDVFILRFC